MNYSGISECDVLNGTGFRVVLFVSGCSHRCYNCQNPKTWDKNFGHPFTEKTRQYIFNCLDKDYIDGITITGGDPLHKNNLDEVLKAGDFKLIHLGIAMQLPNGYMAKIYPRSSTFKNFGIIQANSVGIIDWSYRGSKDEWLYPVIALRDTIIHKNDRICQFEICKTPRKFKFVEYADFNSANRGGIGSTGNK